MDILKLKFLYITLICCSFLLSCKTGALNLFKAASPHEQYQGKLTTTGFDQTAAGSAWINASQASLLRPSQIKLPFKERGYFSAEKVTAIAYEFTATKGQKISIAISQKPVEDFRIYVDLMSLENQKIKSLAFLDTLKSGLEYEIDNTGKYLVRLQPELLTSGEYLLEINYGPSLEYPIKTTSRNNIQSFFGDGRDANTRKHEGVDIFAARLTPVIASANGIITRVNENNLGGKVVWIRPNGKNYTLYYAHLDKQLAIEGQQVVVGDTLGLVGNTGNARTTAPHLHFGIYDSGGAIDPLPFVNPSIKPLPEILASAENLNSTMRTNKTTDIYVSSEDVAAKIKSLMLNSIVKIQGANKNWYRVELPDGTLGYLQSNRLIPITKPIKRIRIIATEQMVFDKPDSTAAIKSLMPLSSTAQILGYSGIYTLIKGPSDIVGWIKTR
ncbi:MAG: M23 family metallopeptidase [Pedobacter sp.]|nr:M23 family metallopeptidase [Pedobacter sp.]